MSSETDPGAADPALEALLDEHRETLLRIVARLGSGLLRYESAEDLVQGIHLHALGVAQHFEYRSDKEFLGWIAALARQHIARRNSYWKAKKRAAAKLLRITFSDPKTGGAGGINPAGSWVTASSIASRKELVALARKALGRLGERDQKLMGWLCEDLSIDAIAAHLEVSYDAAERARLRALDRFRKKFAELYKESL